VPGVYPVPAAVTAPKTVTTPAFISRPVTTEPTDGISPLLKVSSNKVGEAVVDWAAKAVVINMFSPNITW